MGIILDGTYSVFAGLLRISLEKRQQIRAIALEAQNKKREASDALDEILDFLPPESAAAVKQLSSNPLTLLAIILYFISAVSAAVGGVSSAYRTLFPSDPSPQTIVDQNITVNNFGTSGKSGEHRVPQPLSRPERRRLEKRKRKEEELKRKRDKKAAHKRRHEE